MLNSRIIAIVTCRIKCNFVLTRARYFTFFSIAFQGEARRIFNTLLTLVSE